MLICDKSQERYSNAVAKSVLTHETTHAVIHFDIPVGSLSENITGAINEGYADIFGCLVTNSWFYGYEKGNYDRNIQMPNDPSAIQNVILMEEIGMTQPTKYSERYTGTKDKGGVHVNCSLVSYPAYLMHQSHNANGLTWNELAQVWYKSIHMGLSATSTFKDVRRCVIWSAMKLALSSQKLAVIKATFDQVGIGEQLTGTIAGTVRTIESQDAKLLDGVYITVWEKRLKNGRVVPDIVRKTTTSADGEYRFDLEAGKYNLKFAKEGYNPESYDRNIETNEYVRLNVIMKKPVDAKVSGTVTNESGYAVSGALVSVTADYGTPSADVKASTSTNSSGEYSFNLGKNGAGDYTITASKEGYITSTLDVTVEGDTKSADLVLELEVSDDIPVSDDVPAVISGDIPIDGAHFSDFYFRQYLSFVFDTDQNGILSKAEIESVKEINISRSDNNRSGLIKSLKGIEHFTALQCLFCGGNALTALDLSKNIALTDLDCMNNQLTTLGVSNNTALEYLNCSINQLTALDVTNNTALTFLSCNGNQLTELDVSHNTALTELNCGSNSLTALDVSKNTAMTRLECDSDQLTALNVNGCIALTYLSCNVNKLTTLNVSGCTALEGVSCSDNQLTALDLSDCPHIPGFYREYSTYNRFYVICDKGVIVTWHSGEISTASASLASQSDSFTANDSAEVLAVLPALTPTQSGTYTFTASLDRKPPEGSSLVLLSDSEDINGSFVQTDSPMSVKVSADLIAGRTYTSVIVATSDSQSQSGCSAVNIGAMLLLAGVIFASGKRA